MLFPDPIVDLVFKIGFPLFLGAIILWLFLSSRPHRRTDVKGMTTQEYLANFFAGHYVGEEQGRDEYAKTAQGSGAGGGFGKLYVPIVCKGGKFLAKSGFTPNKASILTLVSTFFIFYLTLLAGEGHTLTLYSEQPLLGFILFPTGCFLLIVGCMDGMDGAVATFTNTKTKTGAWFDHVLDKIGDTLLLVCLLPGNFMEIAMWGNMDFSWMVWTNIVLIYIFEYMRAKHHELGLHEIVPLISAERALRIIIQATFFTIYGFNSLLGGIIYLVNGSSVFTTDPYPLYGGEVAFLMWIFQVMLLIIMAKAVVKYGKWTWAKLKLMDKAETMETNQTKTTK